MKTILTLGDARRTLPTHLPLARLPSPDAPWPAAFGTYAGYHFKGYRLAADGTPTFRYEIDGLQVEDTLRPRADGQAFQRTVVIRRAKATDATWYFRGAGTGLAPQPIEWRDGVATFEETLSF